MEPRESAMAVVNRQSSVRAAVRLISTRRLALAGIVGAVLFPVMPAILDIVQNDFLVKILPRFGPLTSNPVGANELGPYGWAMHLNFLLTGILLAAFAIGLRGVLRPSRWSTSAVIVLLAMALGLAMEAFTLDVGTVRSWHGFLHVAGFIVWVLAFLPLPFLLAFAFRRDSFGRRFSWFSLAVGVAAAAIDFAPIPEASSLTGSDLNPSSTC